MNNKTAIPVWFLIAAVYQLLLDIPYIITLGVIIARGVEMHSNTFLILCNISNKDIPSNE